MVNLHEEVRKNKLKSNIILATFVLFSLFLFAIATILIDPHVLSSSRTNSDIQTFILIYSGFIVLLISYLFFFLLKGDKMILKTTGAIPVTKEQYPYLYHTVEALSLAAGMNTSPKCYIIKDSALNAYATGFKPEKSYIVVTTGLLNRLNRQELEGVIAHEMSHIKNQDIKLMLYLAGLIGVFTLIANFSFYMLLTPGRSEDSQKLKLIFLGLFIIFSIIAPFFAILFKLGISRQREYLADSTGALLTRYPEGLASALEKIKNDPDPLVDKANRATAHLFISTPFRKKKFSFFSNLFSTHPPIDERIKRLRSHEF